MSVRLTLSMSPCLSHKNPKSKALYRVVCSFPLSPFKHCQSIPADRNPDCLHLVVGNSASNTSVGSRMYSIGVRDILFNRGIRGHKRARLCLPLRTWDEPVIPHLCSPFLLLLQFLLSKFSFWPITQSQLFLLPHFWRKETWSSKCLSFIAKVIMRKSRGDKQCRSLEMSESLPGSV